MLPLHGGIYLLKFKQGVARETWIGSLYHTYNWKNLGMKFFICVNRECFSKMVLLRIWLCCSWTSVKSNKVFLLGLGVFYKWTFWLCTHFNVVLSLSTLMFHGWRQDYCWSIYCHTFKTAYSARTSPIYCI